MDDLVEPPARPAPAGSRYPEGSFDRLIKAPRHSTVPAWAIYGAIAIALVALELAVTGLEGTFPSRFGLIHLLLPVFAMFMLPALHFFDTLAARALAAARPVLTVDEGGYDDLLQRLTRRPAGETALAGVAGLLALAGLTLVQPTDTYEVLQIMVTPLATVVEWVLQSFVWFGVGIVSFDIARKLRLVDEIYTPPHPDPCLQPRPALCVLSAGGSHGHRDAGDRGDRHGRPSRAGGNRPMGDGRRRAVRTGRSGFRRAAVGRTPPDGTGEGPGA